MRHAYRKLIGRIKELCGSQAKLAKAACLPVKSVCKRLNGRSGFFQEDVEKWAGLLRIERKDYRDFFYA